MKDFAKILGSRWLIDPIHLRPLMERVATATPEAVAAAVAAYHDPQPKVIGDIALIECSGPITHRCSWFSMWYGSSTIESMQAQLRSALQDPAVKTIVWRVDSPGGVIDMVPEFADELFAAREIKPMIAVSDTMIASAASWLFMQCNQVIVPKSGSIGSIGTYMLHEDISQMLEEWGIKLTFIYAGEHKVEGNPYEPLSDEARAHFQSEANLIFGWFNAAVARGRDVTTKVVLDTFGQGRMFYGQTAVKLGMADKVGTFDSIIGRLQGRKRAGAQAFVIGGKVEGAALALAAKKAVDPDEDGNCPDGYEKRDGMCHWIEPDDEDTEAKAEATATCPACKGSGLQPERAMGDPQGQEKCDTCKGAGTSVDADAAARTAADEDAINIAIALGE